MPEEIEKKAEDQKPVEKSLLEQIDEMKKNYVPRAEYEKVTKDRQDLFNRIMNGDSIDEKPKASEISAKDLREKLYVKEGGCKNDLELFEATLKLRKKVMAEGGPDPFVRTDLTGKNPIKKEEYEAAEQLAKDMQDLVDKAEGDPALFEKLKATNIR